MKRYMLNCLSSCTSQIAYKLTPALLFGFLFPHSDVDIDSRAKSFLAQFYGAWENHLVHFLITVQFME